MCDALLQASWIVGHMDQASDSALYYKSLPPGLLWPMLVLATLASVVASQVGEALASITTRTKLPVAFVGLSVVLAGHLLVGRPQLRLVQHMCMLAAEQPLLAWPLQVACRHQPRSFQARLLLTTLPGTPAC